MSDKKLTKRVRKGLATVIAMAEADAAVDEDRYPPSHPVHDAIEYLRKLERGKPEAPDATP